MSMKENTKADREARRMKLSVIVPIYNAEKYLCRCVDSILNQTFTDFELILVDDGSTDRCPAICDEYAKKDGRVRVIHKENGGQGAARNAALAAAGGEYIAFVDSDDWIDCGMYSKMLEISERTDSDLVCCDYIPVSSRIDCRQRKFRIKTFEGKEILKIFLRTAVSGRNNFSCCNKVYKRGLYSNVRFPERTHYDDNIFSTKIMMCARRVTYINQIYYFYFQSDSSVTRGNISEKHLDLISGTQFILDTFRNDRALSASARRIHIKSYFSLLVKIMTARNYPKDIYTPQLINSWIKILRRNFFSMMRSPMDFKRKFVYALFCVNFYETRNLYLKAAHRKSRDMHMGGGMNV